MNEPMTPEVIDAMRKADREHGNTGHIGMWSQLTSARYEILYRTAIAASGREKLVAALTEIRRLALANARSGSRDFYATHMGDLALIADKALAAEPKKEGDAIEQSWKERAESAEKYIASLCSAVGLSEAQLPAWVFRHAIPVEPLSGRERAAWAEKANSVSAKPQWVAQRNESDRYSKAGPELSVSTPPQAMGEKS